MSVLVVAGPPCSGKSTYARARVRAAQIVLDWDELFAEISGLALYDHDERYAARVSDEWRRRFKSMRDGFVISCAPRRQQRAILRHSIGGARSVVLAVPAAVCHARLQASDRPEEARAVQHALIDEWWAAYERSTSDQETEIVS